jgi:hypothetical protein
MNLNLETNEYESEEIGSFVDGGLSPRYSDESDENQSFFNDFEETVTPLPEPKPAPQNFFETEKPDNGYIKRTNDTAAGYIVKTLDGLLAFTLSKFVAKNDNSDKYKASADEINDMTSIVCEMMPKDKVPLPPVAQLGLVLFKVYGAKVDSAFKDRKISELEEKLRQKEREIEELKFAEQKEKIENSMRRDQAKTQKVVDNSRLVIVKDSSVKESKETSKEPENQPAENE